MTSSNKDELDKLLDKMPNRYATKQAILTHYIAKKDVVAILEDEPVDKMWNSATTKKNEISYTIERNKARATIRKKLGLED